MVLKHKQMSYTSITITDAYCNVNFLFPGVLFVHLVHTLNCKVFLAWALISMEEFQFFVEVNYPCMAESFLIKSFIRHEPLPHPEAFLS